MLCYYLARCGTVFWIHISRIGVFSAPHIHVFCVAWHNSALFVSYDIVKRYVYRYIYIYLLIVRHRLSGTKLCLSSSFILHRVESRTIGETSLLILILYIDAKDFQQRKHKRTCAQHLRGYFRGWCQILRLERIMVYKLQRFCNIRRCIFLGVMHIYIAIWITRLEHFSTTRVTLPVFRHNYNRKFTWYEIVLKIVLYDLLLAAKKIWDSILFIKCIT